MMRCKLIDKSIEFNDTLEDSVVDRSCRKDSLKD